MSADTAKVCSDIAKLKKERKALILVHNYQLPEVQDIADLTGDSLGLSRAAANTDSEVIVFCGVHFMAETASILCPDKKVLIPDPESGCPMADMINAAELKELKEKHKDAVVVTYVNSSAEVKAESDYCCTSANSVKVVEKIVNKKIIFVPDKYLGAYTAEKTGRDLILWHGYCPTHVKILPEDIQRKKKEHPGCLVMVHPECTREVCKLADEVASTEGFLRFSKNSGSNGFIVGTEIGMIHRLKKEVPSKNFYPASDIADCPNMKKNTLEKVLWALEEMKHQVEVSPKIRLKAKKAIDRMIEIA
jgi:quinolinate synthase